VIALMTRLGWRLYFGCQSDNRNGSSAPSRAAKTVPKSLFLRHAGYVLHPPDQVRIPQRLLSGQAASG